MKTLSKDLWLFVKDRQNFFITWTSDLTNFRWSKKVSLIIHAKGQVSLEIELPKQNFNTFVGMLGQSLFADNKVVIGWDLKQLFSYLKFNLPCHFSLPIYCELIDIKLCEAFMGINKDCPLDYEEAVKRVGVILGNAAVCCVNQQIYHPLISQVIPNVETLGIVNKEMGLRQHPLYLVEGQANGRLNTKVYDDNFFNPHNLTSEEKSKFSCGYGKKFLVFDFKSAEVSILEWLTKDKVLGDIIKSGKDVYAAIYEIISGQKCSNGKRQWIKSIFLPIVYGSGINRVAELADVPVKAAMALLDTINKKFSTAMSWVQAQQDRLKQCSVIKDCFGRILDFSKGSGREPWSVRNAIVQSPAALIYLEKLIKLYQQRCPLMDVVASIHDAYVCMACTSSWESSAFFAKELLESPSQFAPECILKVDVSVGEDWGNLKKIT